MQAYKKPLQSMRTKVLTQLSAEPRKRQPQHIDWKIRALRHFLISLLIEKYEEIRRQGARSAAGCEATGADEGHVSSLVSDLASSVQDQEHALKGSTPREQPLESHAEKKSDFPGAPFTVPKSPWAGGCLDSAQKEKTEKARGNVEVRFTRCTNRWCILSAERTPLNTRFKWITRLWDAS
jgi:hypothetical protein